MNSFDEKIQQYMKTEVAQTKEADFDSFWAEAIEKAESVPLNVKSDKLEDYPMPGADVYDISFDGIDGTAVEAWFIKPKLAEGEKTPLLVKYHGYTGSRDFAYGYSHFVSLGLAVIAISYRMQGGYTGSATGFQTAAGGVNPFNMGAFDEREHYFYFAHTDAYRAINAGLSFEGIDDSRVCVDGGSQGGGTSLAMAALHPKVCLCFADVPSNCWFEKRILDASGSGAALDDLVNRHPDKLERVLKTMSYFDNINLADRISCPVIISAGMKDPVCPPANVCAAYNRINSEKHIDIYPCGKHNGGGSFHTEKKLRELVKRFNLM